jgi:8-hydroxy-5-deazaflavin:NADPH oxidoreductase
LQSSPKLKELFSFEDNEAIQSALWAPPRIGLEAIINAIQEADVIIPAIYFNCIKEFFVKLFKRTRWENNCRCFKSNCPGRKWKFKKIIGQNESAGKILFSLISNSAKLVKAFGTLGAGSLPNSSFAEPDTKTRFQF